MRYLSAWILLLSASVYGQLITGSISGRVEDPSGLAVSGASVIITRTATNAVRKAASDENGAFVFNGVEPGEYRLSVASAGFKTIERERLTLSSGERLAVGELRLEVGSITETVMVKGEAAHVDTESAARADLITGSQVDGLLNLGRNVTSLVGLLPGVVITRDSNSLDRDTQFNVAGGRMTSNNISIDGVPVVDLDNGFSRKMNVSQDMVAEVKILASNYQAEYGRNSGANIFVVTKSGSRDFHGLASYLKRHEQFNANSFFNNQQGLAKPVYRYNTWTYNVGGPIYIPGRFNRERDKLFFFWGQEFWPTTQSVNGRVTVPTESERAGDFSQTFDVNNRLITVTDPLSKTAFPGNRVPANRINQSGQALLKIFDAPNFFDRNISRGNYNYVFGSPNNVPKTTSTLKLDYNINSNNQIGGTFSTFRETSEGAVGTTGNNANWPQMVMKFNAPNKSAGGRYTRIFTPSIINEFQFGFLRNPESHSYQTDQLMRLQRDKVGFLTPQFHPESNPLKIVPNLTFGGVTSPATINVNGRFPANNQYRVLTFDDKLSIVRGGHSLKAGIFIERDDRDVNQAVAFNGSIDFGRNVNNPLDSGYAYANALLGNFNSYTEPSSRPRIFARAHTVEWFAQDNWKVSRRLTLDFGVRFYWVPPIYDDRDLIAGFAPDRYNVAARARLVSPATVGGQRVGIDPASGRTYPAVLIGSFVPGSGDTANGMVVAAQNNDYPRGLTENPGVQAAPRIGIAFDPFGDGKTSIRSGFGIFYNRLGASVWLPFTAQPPLVTTPNIYYGQLDTLASSAGALFPSNVSGMSRDGKIPSTMNYSFSIQRNVGFSTLVEAAYVGSVARHLTWYRNINPVPAGANFQAANIDPTTRSPLSPAFLRPYLGYNDITDVENAGTSNYNSLQVSANRRFSRGLQFGVAWTWSKSMDFNSDDRASVSSIVPVRTWDYGLSTYDRTHVLKINYQYELPGLRTKLAPLRAVFSGWQVSGVTTFLSGQPLGIGYTNTTSVDTTGTPSQGARVVVAGDPVLPKGEQTFYRFFRTDVFQMPAVGTFGNAAKSVLRGPGLNNWDIAILKNFPIYERLRAQFRCEMYNAWNHTQFNGVDTTARFDPAGRQGNARFGQVISAADPRQIQLALRFYF